uniref:SJCHGC02133 protein n=1 Tax=Schistosoma japonicum TaxID=6182 RepID=Q5BTB0_SCHJA|nr:SJCHGC02133 protein [Schistosoma japonicum]
MRAQWIEELKQVFYRKIERPLPIDFLCWLERMFSEVLPCQSDFAYLCRCDANSPDASIMILPTDEPKEWIRW